MSYSGYKAEICVCPVSPMQAKLLLVVYNEDHCSEQHSHLSKVQLLQSTECSWFSGWICHRVCLPSTLQAKGDLSVYSICLLVG